MSASSVSAGVSDEVAIAGSDASSDTGLCPLPKIFPKYFRPRVSDFPHEIVLTDTQTQNMGRGSYPGEPNKMRKNQIATTVALILATTLATAATAQTPLPATGEEGARNGKVRVAQATQEAPSSNPQGSDTSRGTAQAANGVSVNIPPGDLLTALDTLAKNNNDTQLIYRRDQLQGIRTKGATGTLTTQDAIKKLLEGTQLKLSIDANTGAMLIAPETTRTTSLARDGRETEGEGLLRLAQNDQSTTDPTLTPNPSPVPGEGNKSPESRDSGDEDSSHPVKLEEVVVTAQKRVERLQDVPVPVTALSADSLIDRNQVRLQDYYTRIPGLNLTIGSATQDAPVLSIRGITTGGSGFGANPTVGIVVDDVPYGSSTSFGGGNLVPDLDPSDLSRVEILRGPQGTLYGASSLGGLLKFVTVDPSTSGFSGRLQGGLNSVSHGDGLGYNVRGAVNVPISDTFAVRASAFTRQDAGYIDDPGLGVDGVNQKDSYGGRVAGLWRPSDAISLKLTALVQHSDTGGSSSGHILPGLGDLQQAYILPGLGGYTRDSNVYSAILIAKVAGGELTAISGYASNDVTDSLDRTAGLGGPTQTYAGVGGSQFVERFKTSKFSQEIRFAATLGQRTDWLLGAFYTDESSDLVQDLAAIDLNTGAFSSLPYHNPFEGNYTEYAAFTDFTFHVTDRFDVQLGGRASKNKQDLSAAYVGVFIPPFFGLANPTFVGPDDSKDNSFTYLATPRFRVSPDLMVYARFASGYRPGGPNSNASALGVPSTFDADTTKNYEIGAKGDLLNHALSFDVSAFYIDWSDIQLQVSDPVTFLVFFDNAGKAKSQGVELSLEARPTHGLTIAAAGAWNDAKLKDGFPPGPAVGRSGDRLPFSARESGNLSLDQEFPLASGWTGSVGASFSYVGDRKGVFTPSTARQDFPSYTQLDARAGVKGDSWALDLFVNNVADKRGILGGGIGTAVPFAFDYIQPRTAGLAFSKTF